MSGFGTAVSFLTRVPVPSTPSDPNRLAAAVPWFPVVGALVGAVMGAVFSVAGLILPPLVASGIALALGLLVTGAFHEDGLGDTADALAGGWDREERLRIMRDPRLGTFGVSAVALSILIRVAAIASLERSAAVAALVAAGAMARGASIGLLSLFPASTEEGLGAGYARAVTRGRVFLGGAVSILITGSVAGFLAFPLAVVSACGALGIGWLGRRKVGGLTGDILGAAEQVAEVFSLLLVVAAATNDWLPVPWWR